MNGIIDEIKHVVDVDWKFYYLGIGFLLFLILSFLELKNVTKRQNQPNRQYSYFTNILLLFLNNVLIAFLSISSLYVFTASNTSGLFRRVNFFQDWPVFTFIISFFLYDFLIYFWHYLNHRFNFLWQFHRCHHSDQDLNTSTGVRFHLGELILSILYKIITIIVFGFSVEFILFFEYIAIYFSLFHHTDFKVRGEKWIKYVFVLPVHHATHHSDKKRHHNSNYGVVFSFWDRLLKTYDEYQPSKFGLEYESKKSFFKVFQFGLTIKHSLLIGFSLALFFWLNIYIF